MRRSQATGVRFTVRLKGEDLEAVNRLCAVWGLSRAATVRRAVVQVAARDGSAEGWAVMGDASQSVPVSDLEARLADVEAKLRAEAEPLFRQLNEKIDRVWKQLGDDTAIRRNRRESVAATVQVALTENTGHDTRRSRYAHMLASLRRALTGWHVNVAVSAKRKRN